MTIKLEFKKYCWLMNRIAYYLIINNKKVVTVDKYSFFGKTKTLKEIKEIVKKNGTNYGSDVFITRFVEYAVMHAASYDNFPTSVYTMNDKNKLSREQYVDMVKTVWEYERKNKKHPSLVEVPNAARFKKYGHATSSGCDNRGQNNSVFCGPHSLQEVIRNLTGKVIPQSTLASWAGTSSGGTDHDGISTAIAMAAKKTGVNLTGKWVNFSELGWSGIKRIVNSTNQDCIIHNLYRRNGNYGFGHYEVVNKIYNGYCDVQNSLGDHCNNGCYCGYIEERDLSTFKYYIDGISQKSVFVVTRG